MRILCGDVIISVNKVICEKNKLIFVTHNKESYYTNYDDEYIARCAFRDLFKDGYIEVKYLCDSSIMSK